jgi:protein-L-isoaspartate(D-aspartate) O-methyltransferase
VHRWLRRPRGEQPDAGAGADAGIGGAAPSDWVRAQLETRGIKDPEVLAAMRAVPRERFLPRNIANRAYEDGALPIGHGQTISQPYIVASMTQSLALPAWRAAHWGEAPRVLDVGTGSGYQAAILAEMGADVVSIEIEPRLADAAGRLLDELGYRVSVVVGDGSSGAPDQAPYAAIVVAAASPQIPVPLVEQLLPDGRLVIPVGGRSEQVITLVQRTDDGFSRQPLEPAVFVPLLGEHGFGEH